MSEVAYEDSAKIQAWTCSYCSKYHVEGPKVFSNVGSGAQGFTGYLKSLNSIIISFRGSSNIQNWIINLATTRSTYSGCTGCAVHSGFISAYNGVKNTIRAEV